MISAIFNWIRSWFGFSQLTRTMGSLQRQIHKATQYKLNTDKILLTREVSLHELSNKLKIENEKCLLALKEAKQANEKLQMALETTEQKLLSAEEVTIPGLVNANKVLLQRWEAELAVLAMRTAGVKGQLNDSLG